MKTPSLLGKSRGASPEKKKHGEGAANASLLADTPEPEEQTEGKLPFSQQAEASGQNLLLCRLIRPLYGFFRHFAAVFHPFADA